MSRLTGVVVSLLAGLALGTPALAQSIAAGANYLATSQEADGSWASSVVRPEQATAETLGVLAEVALQPATLETAVAWLEGRPAADNDDLSRRLRALGDVGRDVTGLRDELLAGADPNGGWGLTATFPAGPLDTALAVESLARTLPLSDPRLRVALTPLIASQHDDGGFACIGASDTPSELFCTAQALLALAPLRATYFLDPEIDAAVGSLRSMLNADGSFGPPGTDRSVNTSLAATALAAVGAFGSEVVTTIGYIQSTQRPNGSWEGDPYVTALALRALTALATVTSCGDGPCNPEPFCGDGVVDPGESCDLSDLAGQTCGSLGLGEGLLQCSSDCRLDTSQCDAVSFEIDTRGREFVVGFLHGGDIRRTSELQLASETAATVRVEYPMSDPSFVRTVEVQPGDAAVVGLPTNVFYGWIAGRLFDNDNAVRISSDEEISVVLVHRFRATSDAGMALPVDALGTSYLINTYPGSTVEPFDRGQFLVVAPFDSTTVTIVPTASVRLSGQIQAPDVPFDVNLDRGEGLRLEAAFFGTDLTGTSLEADRPVFVVNGNRCTNVPSDTRFCDHVFQVAHPVQSWGTSALATDLPNRPAGSHYRILASRDDTSLALDGVLQAELAAGEVVEIGPLAGGHFFSADHPIFVTQYMSSVESPGAVLGDPAMINVVPPEQFLEDYTFSTVGGSQFSDHFLSVVAPTATLDSLLLDGSPVDSTAFAPIGETGYSSAFLPLAEGVHTSSSTEPHGITVIGMNRTFDNRLSDSYAYPGDALLVFQNEFCGDGLVNRMDESCDGTDFGGATCTTFGFSGGSLLCSTDCEFDVSRCTGLVPEDDDGDGHPAGEDCDDSDPDVSPSAPEILGNGLDDDCNPATPDEVPKGVLACDLVSARTVYFADEFAALEGRVTNSDPLASLTGVSVHLEVFELGGETIYEESRSLATLPPGARSLQNFAFPLLGEAASYYLANFSVLSGDTVETVCGTLFQVEGSASSGVGLTGTLELVPETVDDSGEPSAATYTVTNRGNEDLADVAIRVVLVDPGTGEVVVELTDSADLAVGATVSVTQLFSTDSLVSNRSYLAVLLALPAGIPEEITLDSTSLAVSNAPPVCSAAVADREMLWPPNHKLVAVAVEGVSDPDGDPVTVTVTGVLQDERTDELGSGDTCPDAEGVGTSSLRLRAERSGRQDGRVYHVFFTADDGRGASCEGVIEVCVPHSKRSGCGDQGQLFDSTACN